MDDARREALWSDAEAYDAYIGRWSRVVAREFLAWLDVAPQAAWLDVACGTGVLTRAILERCDPARVDAFDLSAPFLERAANTINDRRAEFRVADAQALPTAAASFDAAVVGLALNAFPEPRKALAELVRSVRRSGLIAAYVWDFDGEMQMLRYFWEAALELDPDADSDRNVLGFALCKPEPLSALFETAGLTAVETRAIDAPTAFVDFDDYWTPITRGGAPAQRYVASLGEPERTRLREHVRARLPVAKDGSIALIARAWAVKGTVDHEGRGLRQ